MVNINGLVTSIVDSIGGQFLHLSTAETIILDIGLILILSTFLAFFAKIFKQPLIPAYVITGLIIGPLVLGYIKNTELITAFSEIGIAFLLFTAGLEISFRKIREANLKKILIIGIAQVLIIFSIAFFLAGFLGLSNLQAAYIGVILAFGSTMVDIKLLSDRGELVTLHGRLVLGILLLQDLIAIIAIVVFKTGGFEIVALTIAFSKLLLILAVALILQKFVLNKIFKFAARSSELLFLASLAVLFMFIILSYLAELSIVIGAFIAGVSLANSRFKIELESRVTPLRDFFAILFFVALGTQIVFEGIGDNLRLLSALIIIGIIIKPLFTFILMRIGGYRPKTSFFTAISLAQLSEFSLIIGILGVSLGVLDAAMFSTIILATIITMSLTPYFIEFKENLYKFVMLPLSLFRFLPISERLEYKNDGEKEILLIGAHRMGSILLKDLVKDKKKLLVIDYNPEIINVLMKHKISCIYGDIVSPEILSKVNSKRLKLVVSTVPDYNDNLHLLNIIKRTSPKTKVIVTGGRISETIRLYENGADYVITPKILAGEKISAILKNHKLDLKRAKRDHIRKLRNIHKVLY